MPSRDDVALFVVAQLTAATGVAEDIGLTENRRRDIYCKSANQSISDFPWVKEMRVGYGAKRWAAILFVDMRESTSHCEEFGPRMTYLTMHTYLSTMAYLVKQYKGVVVGLRGDGLFAAFGLDENGDNPTDLDHGKCVQTACLCGRAMIETVDEVIGPLLEREVKGERTYKRPIIGCGVDAAEVVLTRIGFLTASEVTAYGTAVNKAAKMSGTNFDVVITPATKELFPQEKGGPLKFVHSEKLGGLIVKFPLRYSELDR